MSSKGPLHVTKLDHPPIALVAGALSSESEPRVVDLITGLMTLMVSARRVTVALRITYLHSAVPA